MVDREEDIYEEGPKDAYHPIYIRIYSNHCTHTNYHGNR